MNNIERQQQASLARRQRMHHLTTQRYRESYMAYCAKHDLNTEAMEFDAMCHNGRNSKTATFIIILVIIAAVVIFA